MTAASGPGQGQREEFPVRSAALLARVRVRHRDLEETTGGLEGSTRASGQTGLERQKRTRGRGRGVGGHGGRGVWGRAVGGRGTGVGGSGSPVSGVLCASHGAGHGFGHSHVHGDTTVALAIT